MKPLAVAALIAGLALPLAAQAEPPSPIIRSAPRRSICCGFQARCRACRRSWRRRSRSSSSPSVRRRPSVPGASSPAASYPSRLAVELETLLPDQSITVLNRGVNGEEVPDMLKRFETAVIAPKPDLVLWQLGTNSVIHDQMITDRDNRDPRRHPQDPRHRRRRCADRSAIRTEGDREAGSRAYVETDLRHPRNARTSICSAASK